MYGGGDGGAGRRMTSEVMGCYIIALMMDWGVAQRGAGVDLDAAAPKDAGGDARGGDGAVDCGGDGCRDVGGVGVKGGVDGGGDGVGEVCGGGGAGGGADGDGAGGDAGNLLLKFREVLHSIELRM